MASARLAHKAATRAKVLDAAGVCFRTLGYERSTIRDIANNAGVSTGAIFSNWSGKDALYRELFGHAPVSPELGRALLLAGRNVMSGSGIEALQLGAVIAQVEEA